MSQEGTDFYQRYLKKWRKKQEYILPKNALKKPAEADKCSDGKEKADNEEQQEKKKGNELLFNELQIPQQ